MIVVWLFFIVPRVCLQFVIVVFPEHTHLQKMSSPVTSNQLENMYHNSFYDKTFYAMGRTSFLIWPPIWQTAAIMIFRIPLNFVFRCLKSCVLWALLYQMRPLYHYLKSRLMILYYNISPNRSSRSNDDGEFYDDEIDVKDNDNDDDDDDDDV